MSQPSHQHFLNRVVALQVGSNLDTPSEIQPRVHERTNSRRSQGTRGVIRQEGRALDEALALSILFALDLRVALDEQANSAKGPSELHY